MPDVLMPRLSDTMEEGVLSLWLKHEGDPVRKGDVLAEIETDKATMELEAYDDGVLERLLVKEGATVPIEAPIGVIGDGSGTAAAAASPPEAAAAPRAAATPAPPTPAAPAPAAAHGPVPTGPILTSPLARRTARAHGLDLASVTGTGPGGRIVRADVEAAVAATGAPGRSTPTPAGQPGQPGQPGQLVQSGADDEVVQLSAVRRVTARRLTESASAPQFYLTAVVDAGRLLSLRAEINGGLAAEESKVSVNDLLVRACALTLRAHPQVNSSWGGDVIVRHRQIHVGIAVAIDDGLVVPVIRDADRKSLGEISAQTRELAQRARAGRMAPDEFTGGTFTISNLGMYGVDHFTAVINPPEAAILAVGAATEEPAVRDGQVVARTTIKLTVSIDHRVLDGATAAAFLRDLKDTLEMPLRIVV